jgi:hypothetical protein
MPQYRVSLSFAQLPDVALNDFADANNEATEGSSSMIFGRYLSIVVTALLMVAPTSLLATNPVEVSDGTNDLFSAITFQSGPNNAGAGQPVASVFYGDFIDITQASVSLDGDIYTFALSVVGQVLPANPEFPGHPSTPVQSIDYFWRIIDCTSGSCVRLGSIAVHWRNKVVTADLEVLVGGSCPGPELGPECRTPEFAMLPLSFAVDGSGHSLSVTISQSDLADFVAQSPFGSHPTHWRALTRAFIDPTLPIVSSGGVSVNDAAPNAGPPAPLP